jgi:hypothetical protein
VGIIKEMMDTEDIKSLIDSLNNLTKDSSKEKKENAHKKMKQLALGAKLFGFKKEAPKKRMSEALGELKMGSEFEEVGVLEEALESTKRKTMVDALQNMIEISKHDKQSDKTGKEGIFGKYYFRFEN